MHQDFQFWIDMSCVRKFCPFGFGRTIGIVRLSLVLVRCLDRYVV
jgi:hypothetical protein